MHTTPKSHSQASFERSNIVIIKERRSTLSKKYSIFEKFGVESVGEIKMSSNILDVKRSVIQQDDVIHQQYHTYAPYAMTFTSNDEIRITIQSQDLYVLPSESYLHIEFTVARQNGEAMTETLAQFPHFFITHMFSEIRYELNGFEIDRCKSPGITSLLKYIVACKEEYGYSSHLWDLNGGANIKAQSYKMVIPLHFLFGFCDDFKQIVLNSTHQLIITRHRSNKNMFHSNDNTLDLKFEVGKILWKVPHVSLNDMAKLSMLKTLSRNENLPIAFRSWDLYELPAVPQTTRHTWSVKTTKRVSKPRFVVVAFQTNRNIEVENDATLFDHCNVTNMKLYLNNQRFPYDDMNLNFDKSNYQELFMMLASIQKSYYNATGGSNPMLNGLTYARFIERPVFAFDCTRTDESIKTGMVDVRLEIETSANFPENTTAFCLIIHDNLVHYSPYSSIVERVI